MTKIPAAILTRHSAFLGMNGTGKTSVAKVAIAEPLLAEGQRTLILDPAGAWFGLRLRQDGATPSRLKIYIFGGRHGDYPLRPKDATVLAEAFATSSDSAIFDTSEMTGGDRTEFFIGFAETLFRKNRGTVNLIIDEAHVFMPQAGGREKGRTPMMLHAGNNLVSLGRGRGIRVTMISQRAAKIHKDSLTQAHAMFALRVMAPQDRKAIAEWIAEQADPGTGKQVMDSLSTLKAGEAWVWSPADNYLDRVRFPLPRTFDSSKSDGGEDVTLEPIRLEDLTGKLAAIEEERKANDPTALKAELAKLRRELAAKPAEAAPVDMEQMGVALRTGRLEGALDMAVLAEKELADLAGALGGVQGAIILATKRIEGAVRPIASKSGQQAATPAPRPAVLTTVPERAARPIPTPPAPAAQGAGSAAGTLNGGALKMLDALVASYPMALPTDLWGLAVGKSPESAKAGPWYRQRGVLVAEGLIEEAGDGFRATPAGVAKSSAMPANPADAAELWRIWRPEIAEYVGAAAMAMLRTLALHQPHRLRGDQWALLSGKSAATAKAGPWYGGIKVLRTWGLIEGDGAFGITAKGNAVVGPIASVAASTREAIRLARRAALSTSQRHYDAIVKRPMTRKELADALGVSEQSAKAGPWYGAIKEMIEAGLVHDDGGVLTPSVEDLK